jgi:hypothetical protein
VSLSIICNSPGRLRSLDLRGAFYVLTNRTI